MDLNAGLEANWFWSIDQSSSDAVGGAYSWTVGMGSANGSEDCKGLGCMDTC